MLRRWLIRLPFLLALAFVIAVWVTSYFRGISMNMYWGQRGCGVSSVDGLGGFIEGWFPPHRSHFYFFIEQATAEAWDLAPATLGFRCGAYLGRPDSLLIVLPLWLPTLVLTVLLWFVWRKTRGRKGPGGAFPVEPAKSPAKSE